MKQLSLMDASRRPLLVLMSLSWPAILEQLLLTLATYVDTAMVGSLGAGATSAVAINSSPIWLINGLLAALAVGYSVQVANNVGAEDVEGTRNVIRQAVLATSVIGGGLTIVCLSLSRQIPIWMGCDPSILSDAQSYLSIYMMALPMQASLAIFSSIMRCLGDTRTPLIVNAGANFLNIILNFLFIFPTRTVEVSGNSITIWGAGLGVSGAAIATAISGAIAGLLLISLFFIRKDALHISFKESFRLDAGIAGRAISLSIPVALERTTISCGQLVMTRMVASLGTFALAANHIAVTAEGLCYLPAYGIGFAATALVGQAMGAKKPSEARRFGQLSIWVGALFCAAGGLLLFIFATQMASIFSTDPEVIALAAKMLRIVSVSEPLFAVSIVLSGALRGAGDTKYPFYFVLLGMWGVRVILAPILIFGFKFGLEGVWIAMVADLCVRGVFALWRFYKFPWNSFFQDKPSAAVSIQFE